MTDAEYAAPSAQALADMLAELPSQALMEGAPPTAAEGKKECKEECKEESLCELAADGMVFDFGGLKPPGGLGTGPSRALDEDDLYNFD